MGIDQSFRFGTQREVGDDDVAAFGKEESGEAEADARAGACDEGRGRGEFEGHCVVEDGSSSSPDLSGASVIYLLEA